jgi:hypothetical protein
MSASNKIAEGEKKRRDYVRSRIKGNGASVSQADKLDPPLVKDILPGLPEGLLPVSVLLADLDVQIPYWNSQVGPGFYAEVTVNIMMPDDSVVYGRTERFQGPLGADAFPLQLNIPQANIPHEGVFNLAYDVFVSDGTDNSSESRVITIDRTAPYYNPDPQLAFPPVLQVPANVITDATFAGGVTSFDCTLPDYPELTAEDRIVVYWGPGLPEGPNAPDPAFGPVVVPADRKIPIPKTVITDRPNGPTFAVYWLTDKAGNVSSISKPAEVDVQLGGLPADLKDPDVPLGPLVDLADAHLGVTVLIPAFNNPGGSIIKATWGGTALGEVTPGSVPRDTYVPVPWSTLKAEYAGGPGEMPVTVGYQVKRGSLLFPAAPLTKDVSADFSTIGPGNPNEPDPVNPDLLQVHLIGADGGQDHLTPSDDGLDVTATVALYTPVNAGEVLSLYWGVDKTPVDDFTVVAEQPGDLINFTIPWAAIEAQANNAALPMYYTINSATGNNPQQSVDTLVNVDVLRVGFEPVSFPDLFVDDVGNKTLSCASLYSEDYDNPLAKFGFRVEVPADTDLKPGDEVIAVWQGYDFDGTTEIPATRFTHTHPPLTQGEADNGFIFLVEPYADHILPIGQGFAEVTYTVTPAGGGTPVPANPMPAKQYVTVIRPGGITCQVPPPKPQP